ncbi:MAG: hypothetical protein B6I24_00990 [Bacteroidetes bacterium 4572_128]|nr:MAG: hypothetical protein B6I24_00990 [Bacteroidetes bacterium 4572_128]
MKSTKKIIEIFIFFVIFLIAIFNSYKLSIHENQINRQKQIIDSLKQTIVEFETNSFVSSSKYVLFRNQNFETYKCDVKKVDLKFYYKDTTDRKIKSIDTLKHLVSINNKVLIFATNAGMYNPNNEPQGLYVENKKIIKPLDLNEGKGNFYMKPNGVFYITENNTAGITESSDYLQQNSKNIKYATQSGPLLLINGDMHPKFNEGSKNKHIRSGVGLVNAHQVVFIISNEKVNFFDFALLFKKFGCKNALYLDGGISKMYLPDLNRFEKGGNFGVIIGVTTQKE